MNEEKKQRPDELSELRILVVDDDVDLAESLMDILEPRGYRVALAHSVTGALKVIKSFDAHVALLDVRLGAGSGIDLIKKMRAVRPNILCVMMTAYADVENAVEALQEGAYDYLRKPLLNFQELFATLDRCFEKLRLEREKAEAEQALRLRNQELQEINARLRDIVESTKEVAACSRWGQLGAILLEEFGRNLSAGGGSLFLREGDSLVLVHSLDPGHAPSAIAFPLRKGSIFERALAQREPILVSDIEADQNIISSGWKGYKSDSLLAFPLIDEQGEVTGIISLHDKIAASFTPQDRELGTLLASYGSETIRAARAVEALRESEEKYRTILESIKEGYFEMDSEGNFTFFNDSVCEIWGYSREHLLGRNHRQYATPETTRKMDKVFEEIRCSDKPVILMDYEIASKNKGKRVLEMSTSAMLDASGQCVGFRGVARDVTERKRAEEERQRLVTAIEHTAEGISITNQDGLIRYVNPAFERITGYRRDEVLGKDFRYFTGGEDGPEAYEAMWSNLRNGEVWNGQWLNQRKDGALREMETTVSPIRDDTGAISGFVFVNRDVTHEVQLKKQLLQAQKMEAVGTLAGGIAHDFNNLLQAVQGYAELLLLGKHEGEPGYRKLHEIVRAARRGGELTQQLLTFSRKGESKRVPLDLNEEIRGAIKLLERTIPKMIAIELNLAENLMVVEADPVQVEQVLMNLVVNAKDAMPDGGNLRIQTENVTIDEEYCRTALEFAVAQREANDELYADMNSSRMHVGVNPGDYVLLSITDTGHGMDRETQDHIFEPFYTTKGPGRGTGLGLAMVYGIVKSYEGHIDCSSAPGQGTTFRIYLPAIEKPVSATPVEEPEVARGNGVETILVVDDEDFIRDLGEQVLTQFGYMVLTASSGEEAVELYRREQRRINLVVLDLIMPGMGGRKCLEELVRINPEVKVIVSSGYAPTEIVTELESGRTCGFIGKPFNVKHMLKMVRGILDGELCLEQTGAAK